MLFGKLFETIRQGVKNAILGGVADAQAELEARIENREPLLIEADPVEEPEPKTNGKARRRVIAR